MKRCLKFVFCLLLVLGVAQISVWANETKSVNTLDSQNAVNQALDADLSLKAAKLDLDVAQQNFESSKRFLNLAGGYSTSKNDSNGWQSPNQYVVISSGAVYDPSNINPKWVVNYTPSNDLADPSKDSVDYKLTVYPFNMGNEKNVKSAELNYVNRCLAFENTKIKLITDVRNAYAEAVQKEELYKLAILDLELSRDQLKKTNVLYTVGKIPRLDLMDAEQQVKAAEAKLNTADLDQQAGLLKLSTLLRRDDLQGVALQGETLIWATTAKINLPATIESYLKGGFDVKAAELNVKVAKIQLMMDSYYLLKNFSFGVESNNSAKNGNITSYNIGFSGQLDDTYCREHNSSQKKLDSAQLNLEVITRNKKTQIIDAYRSWQIMELSVAPMHEMLNIALERLRIVNLKYENGMASGTDVNQARMLLTKAQEDYWNTWFNLQKARETFYQAVAGNPIYKPE